ncbi:MAG TPA: hypothetical protein VGE52_16150 [Pirellulales bacterium]
MATQQEKQTGYFQAERADTGEKIKVLIYTMIYSSQARGQEATHLPGRPRLADRTGNAVKRVDKGKYLLCTEEGDIELTSRDPNAP